MKRTVLALLVSTLPAAAHDLWIEPSSFHPAPGADVTAALRVGQRLQGDPLPRIPTLVERFFVKGAGAEVPLVGVAGADPAGFGTLAGGGLQWIGYQSGASPVTLDAAKFESYLKEEGLERVIEERARTGRSAAPGRERFSRCAKALLDAGGAPETQAKVVGTPLGFTLELVPKKNPYAVRDGGELPLTLLFRGRPLAGALVVAFRRDAPDARVSARTDRRGAATLRLAGGALWLIKAVHMEAAPAESGVDWESWWASITFERAK